MSQPGKSSTHMDESDSEASRIRARRRAQETETASEALAEERERSAASALPEPRAPATPNSANTTEIARAAQASPDETPEALAPLLPHDDAQQSNSPKGETAPERRRAAKVKKVRKVRSDSERAQQRQVARDQRKRHAELVKTWMPVQRGANMTLATRIGSQAVESWFKRTFVRLSRMLYRIHSFPLQHIAPEVIRRIESEITNAIGRTEGKISQLIAHSDRMLERVGARPAYYSKHFELEIVVSTKTAMALHAVYHRADELHLRVESLDFAGLLTEAQRQKHIGAIHAAIFGLAQSIERFHAGLFVRVAQAAPETAEIDAAAAARIGKPVDHPEEDGPEVGAAPASTCTPSSPAVDPLVVDSLAA